MEVNMYGASAGNRFLIHFKVASLSALQTALQRITSWEKLTYSTEKANGNLRTQTKKLPDKQKRQEYFPHAGILLG